MGWFKDRWPGVVENAIYDWGCRLIALLWPFILTGIYTILARLKKIPWNWTALIFLLLVSVIILAVTAYKLIERRHVTASEIQPHVVQASPTALSDSSPSFAKPRFTGVALVPPRDSPLNELREATSIIDIIGRRVTDLAEKIDWNVEILELVNRTGARVDKARPTFKRLEPIEQELIDRSKRVDREISWPEFTN